MTREKDGPKGAGLHLLGNALKSFMTTQVGGFLSRELTQFMWAAILLGLLACLSCAPKPKPGPKFMLLDREKARQLLLTLDLSNQGLHKWEELDKALGKSLHYVQNKEGMALNIPGGITISWDQVRRTLSRLRELLPAVDKNPELLLDEFDFYLLTKDQLFTGYFEPQLDASLEKRPGYPYPLYGLPKDLKVADLGRFHPRWQGQKLVYRISRDHIEPYYARREIDGGHVLVGKAPVLAWAKNLLDVFILQIQGSGQLLLPNGERRYVGYAGKNGRQYVSLGRYLVEQGYLQYADLSLETIYDFLEQREDLLPEILFVNPSYVFFRFNKQGPLGAMGEPLTPLVSLAVDPASIPLGGVMFFQVDLPAPDTRDQDSKVANCEATTPPVRLGLAQDVGGAIKGDHLDLFCGTGQRAMDIAGQLKARGQVCLLLGKQAK